MNRAELKQVSKGQIKGKIGILFVVALIMGAISFGIAFVLSLIPVAGMIISPIVSVFILTPAFSLSFARVYLTVAGNGKPEAKDAFSGFDDFWSAFKVTFLVGLFTLLWSLLFVIPGIVKTYAYSMSLFVLAENKGMSALECINESKKITDGHKMELFVLDLSFIGWCLLGSITCGIAYIWVMPYMLTTGVNAYKFLKYGNAAVVEPESVLNA